MTDEENQELAEEFGFDDVLDLELFYASQAELMFEVRERYDLESKNDVNVSEIFYQIMIDNRNRDFQITTLGGKILNVNEDIGCDYVFEACNFDLFFSLNLNNPDFIEEHFCSAHIKDSPGWDRCVKVVSNRAALEWVLTKNTWCVCLLEIDCDWTQDVFDACGV